MKRAEKLDKKLVSDAAQKLAPDNLIALLRKRRYTTKELCTRTGATEREVMDAIYHVQGRGFLLDQFGDAWGMHPAPLVSSDVTVFKSQKDGTYVYGFSSDQHLGSKHERLDVLNDLYNAFAEEGVERVYNCGNWIDGEARFNMHELKVHGMDEQIDYLIEQYPQRPGITTYAVAGDDHEGWYGQREGIDIGKHAERKMRECGRKDWVNLGFMEAYVALEHSKSKQRAMMLNMHPGGGSSYATSYRPQKIVEGFSGGEKPAVLNMGHYHKMSLLPVRNVWTLQCGCAQDQTTFMRKKGIDPHVGGGICTLKQDQETGAIVRCKVEFMTYFNKGHYNQRWAQGGEVQLAPRGFHA